MLRTTAISLAAAASLTLAALTPALADVSQCEKQPNADTCPTMGVPRRPRPRRRSRPRISGTPATTRRNHRTKANARPSERARPSIFFRL